MLEETYHPEQFLAKIGGYMGPSYSVSKSKAGLRYRSFKEGYTPCETVTIAPSRIEWELFQKVLDEIGVWNWEPQYLSPGTCDGTQWRIEIHWGDKRITSHGDNNYPGTTSRMILN